MSISHLLESFSGSRPSEHAVELSQVDLEDQKLEAFERGYKAGWDDAAKAQTDDRKTVTSDLAANLHDLSFTYNEAHFQMVKSLKPFLENIVASLLPDIARNSLGPQIVEQLGAVAEAAAGVQVELVVAPANGDAVRAMVEAQANMPVSIVEEASLAPGQAFLRFGDSEREINQPEVLDGIRKAVDAFFHEMSDATEKEQSDAG